MSTKLMYLVSLTVILNLASSGHAVVIGNWEQNMDGWVVGSSPDVDIRYSDVIGVTLDNYSLDVFVPQSDWQEVLKINALSVEGLIDAIKSNQKISVDVTRLTADWPGQPAPQWGGLHIAFNAGGEGWNIWQEFGFQGGWVPSNGDQTQNVVWSYADYLAQMNFDSIFWFEILLHTNYDPAYTGGVLLYIDNMQLFGGGRALSPQPANNARDVNVETTLSWQAGADAELHYLYLGTNLESVTNANMASDPNVIFAITDTPSFEPDTLQFNTRYYWRVDEINEANPQSPWKSDIWSFTTANFIIVDDFEGYTNDIDAGKAIFQTWLDGWEDPTNGSQVGNEQEPYAAQTIKHSGNQSMPLQYNNSDSVYSEAERNWTKPQDWTLNNYNALKLYIMGQAGNDADQVSVTLEDTGGNIGTEVYPDPAIVTIEEWKEWIIPLSKFTAFDVNVTEVAKIVIGVGSVASPLQTQGTLFIDDIRVGPKPLDMVAYYALENNTEDSSGNGFHGTAIGDPIYIEGPVGFGTGILFDGTNTQYVELGNFNPSAATGQLTVSLWANWNGLTDYWQGLIGKRIGPWEANGMMWQIEANQINGALRFQREGTADIQLANSLPIGEWTHVAVTFDGVTVKGYINGTITVEAPFSFGLNTEAPIQFGSSTSGAGNPFNGALDEIRLYDRVLSEAEIIELSGR